MTSSYKFHDGVGEIVPFYARYQYPTQANKAWKSSVKIPPKNGTTFSSDQYGASITIDLPAQGYLHCANSTLTFDVEINQTDDAKADDGSTNTRMQNNIQSIFDRMRLTYGSLAIEDLRKANVIVRLVSEATGNSVTNTLDQCAIGEGIGGLMSTMDPVREVPANQFGLAPASQSYLLPPVRMVNTRLHAIQSYNYQMPGSYVYPNTNTNAVAPGDTPTATTGPNDPADPNATDTATTAPTKTGSYLFPQGLATYKNTPTRRTRRYTVQLPFGLFQQNKLLPLKWMASQLSISLDLAPPSECMVQDYDSSTPYCKYTISNMFFNAELMEYDSSYDAAFLEGLRGGGVPIKFSSWNTYINSPSGGSSQTILIPERNRSLKNLYTVLVPPSDIRWDSHAFMQSAAEGKKTFQPSTADAKGALVHAFEGFVRDYQYRIGGKYLPSTPVQCGSGDVSNGAAEAYIEFAKALNVVGDYRLHSGISPSRWSLMNKGIQNISLLNDWGGIDRMVPISDVDKPNNRPDLTINGPSFFVIAANLETSTGGEISGLNGEEQNDIALVINYSAPQYAQCTYYTFVYYDALLVLRENNLVELIK